MCAGKHASLGICVQGNNKLGETHIPATPGTGKEAIQKQAKGNLDITVQDCLT